MKHMVLFRSASIAFFYIIKYFLNNFNCIVQKFWAYAALLELAPIGPEKFKRHFCLGAAAHMGRGRPVLGFWRIWGKGPVATKKFAYAGPIGNTVRDVPPRPGRNSSIWKYWGKKNGLKNSTQFFLLSNNFL